MGNKNKEIAKEQSRKHYLENKDKIKERSRIHNDEQVRKNKELVLNFLLKNPCIDCGESDPIVLEFDHVKGVKKGDISKMTRQAYCEKTLIEEIDKCEVRCANCHRRITYKRRNNIGE